MRRQISRDRRSAGSRSRARSSFEKFSLAGRKTGTVTNFAETLPSCTRRGVPLTLGCVKYIDALFQEGSVAPDNFKRPRYLILQFEIAHCPRFTVLPVGQYARAK